MGLATGWMLLFISTCAALILFLTFAAQHMFSEHAISMAPLVVALSMMVDGFVLGPIEQLSRSSEGEHPLSGNCPDKWMVFAALSIIAAVLLLLVVPSAGPTGAAGLLEPPVIAGTTFIFGLRAFYLASAAMVLARPATIIQCARWFGGQFMKAAHVAAAVVRGAEQGWRCKIRVGAFFALVRILGYWAVIVSAFRLLVQV
jgi:hypothetical protein